MQSSPLLLLAIDAPSGRWLAHLHERRLLGPFHDDGQAHPDVILRGDPTGLAAVLGGYLSPRAAAVEGQIVLSGHDAGDEALADPLHAVSDNAWMSVLSGAPVAP